MENFEKWPLLGSIKSPADFKALSEKQLDALAKEIRDYLVFRVGVNGGHLASNLGVVELTMALHRVFDSPHDHIIFDVGHQSYVHKLLTGRGERFDTLRTSGGLSGFTKRAESEHDPFGAGHSSTAISAAIGMAEADALAEKPSWTVAVVGDGALTGGLCYEALNNCRRNLRVLIVINENEMSISPNTGRLAKHLSRIRTSRSYIRTKKWTGIILRHVPLIGPMLYRIMYRVKRRIKHALYHENLFEHMGIRYFGPVDGNDLEGLTAILSHAKEQDCSAILHVKTVKGKGYAPAECDANTYHSLPAFGKHTPSVSFSSTMGEALRTLAAQDERICAITAAMRDGTGLVPFAATFPRRFFDVGIAEGHALTFAAGLAAANLRPVVALYSSFLQRAYDNLLHDTALQGLPVVLCIDRAGLNAGDGPTHHGVFDVALLSALPGVQLFAPISFVGVRRALRTALASRAPSALRYPSGEQDQALLEAFYPQGEAEEAPLGVRRWESGEQPAVVVVTHGRIAAQALQAAKRLEKEGITVRILLCEYLAPYSKLAAEIAPLLCGGVLFLEEEIRAGGFGMLLSDALRAAGDVPERYEIMALENGFLCPGVGETPLQAAGLDAAHIEQAVRRLTTREGE